MVYDPEYIDPPTPEEKAQAHRTHQLILALIGDVRNKEANLDANYARLGAAMYAMQAKKYWIILGYRSWSEYFELLEKKYGTGRTQLYAYLGAAKALMPDVSEQTMGEMGISRAQELKKAMVTTGKKPSPELLAKATNPKIGLSQFRADVMKEFHMFDHNPKGEWFDLKGVYFTEDEKAEFLRSVDVAKRIDPPIDHTLPYHVQFKEVLLRFAREFWAEYGACTPNCPEEKRNEGDRVDSEVKQLPEGCGSSPVE